MANPGRGFTLIELVVVMLILAVLIGMAAKMSSGLQEAAERRTTEAKLAAADEALRNFVTVARRLPCPADGALPSGHAMAGRERRTAGACDDLQARGVLPWVALGLREDDAVDGYNVRLTYRVGPDLVSDDALFMSACDAAGLAAAVPGVPGRCNQMCVDGTAAVPGSCTPPRAVSINRGLRVESASGIVLADPSPPLPTDPPTGAAYVLLSHGANKGGGYGREGVVQDAPAALAVGEVINAAPDTLKAYYVDDAGLDDRMTRPSIIWLTQRAYVGPRPHRPL